jgi:hypothetical protein
MLESTRDQATDYLMLLLENYDGSPAENFQLLRQISVTVAGDKIYRESIVSKSEVDAQMLKYYLERVEIDLIIYKETIAKNLTKDMMAMATIGSVKKPTKKQTEARAKAVAKAAKKNIILSEIGIFTAEDCGKLYKTIKSESVNVYNTFWHMNLNKDHSIPSGKQLVALLNSMRVLSFDKKEIKRVFYLKANREKVRIKKESMKGPTEEVKEDSESGDDPDEGNSSGVEDEVVINVEVNYFIIEISFFFFSFSFFSCFS